MISREWDQARRRHACRRAAGIAALAGLMLAALVMTLQLSAAWALPDGHGPAIGHRASPKRTGVCVLVVGPALRQGAAGAGRPAQTGPQEHVPVVPGLPPAAAAAALALVILRRSGREDLS
ncbi:hypothetical protein AB0H82_10715 [Streptomyces sp. NPDC050732]|uniref:hypothetical protein n=1 Tax=Streptomyces sp. NPDC050732 TaxID=3154632 RepID=UPI003417C424